MNFQRGGLYDTCLNMGPLRSYVVHASELSMDYVLFLTLRQNVPPKGVYHLKFFDPQYFSNG